MSVDSASMTLGRTGEVPVDAPTEGRVDAPAEGPVETPAQAWMEAPAPAQAWMEAPAEGPVETPAQAWMEAPAPAQAWMEAPTEGPVETPVNLPVSLGVVGYAAFALLQPIPLSEIISFPLVVRAFEAEASGQVPEPEPEPEPEDIVAVFPVTVPPAPEPVVSYAVGGYRPAPGPQTWGHELPEPGHELPEPGHELPEPPPASECAPPEVEAPADDSPLEEMAALGEMDRLSVGVMAVPASKPFRIGGYAANRPSADQQARQVLDELSFLFDGS